MSSASGRTVGGWIAKTTLDANAVIKADTDDTPVALTVAEDTLVGRIAGDVIDDLAATQVRTIINVEYGSTADQTKEDIDALGLSHDSLTDVSADDHHSESHTIASHNDTSATGTELNTLTDGSDADSLHVHPDYTPRTEWLENGFENLTDSVMTFVDGTETFSIQPTATSFDFWVDGVKYTSTGDTVVIDGSEGIHVIYYDDDTLASVANPTSAQVDAVIKTKAIVSILYWDVSAGTIIYFGEERHGKSMAPATHAYLHFTEGLRYLSGLGLNTFDTGGGGSTAEAQFGVSAGAVTDEDLYDAIDAIASTIGLPIYYMLGSAEWQKHTEAGFSMRTVDGTTGTRLAYNLDTAGTWSLADVGNNDFVLCHVFATTEKDNPIIAIMGQAKYTTTRKAREGAQTEIFNLVTNDLLFPEIKALGSVIFKTNTSYASAINGTIQVTDLGENYEDFRLETISSVSLTTTDHQALTNRDAGDAHEQYLLADGSTELTGDMTVTALKTIDGRDLSVDGTKLDTIDENADVTGSNAPQAHKTSHENGGTDEISVVGLSGELADDQPPKAHAASHTDGSDDIRDATAAQKGLATAAQITKLDAVAENADVTADNFHEWHITSAKTIGDREQLVVFGEYLLDADLNFVGSGNLALIG